MRTLGYNGLNSTITLPGDWKETYKKAQYMKMVRISDCIFFLKLFKS